MSLIRSGKIIPFPMERVRSQGRAFPSQPKPKIRTISFYDFVAYVAGMFHEGKIDRDTAHILIDGFLRQQGDEKKQP